MIAKFFRSFRLALVLFAVVAAAYWFWEPGAEIRDGSHDQKRNGLWLAHGWLGADQWFSENARWPQVDSYRSAEALKALTALCAAQHITDLFPHLCPCGPDGRLPPVDDAQIERFLDTLTPGRRVLPWIGGPSPSPASYQNERWRATFCQNVRSLLTTHPRLHGVQVNIEPLPSGDPNFLKLLEQLRQSLPPGKILSVAAYPPPTRWQPSTDVHWDESFFRAVAQRADHLAVMMYDTGIRQEKFYRKLMSDWTVEILRWSEGKPVLLGVAAYEEAGVGYHDPSVENLKNGLLGIHAGLRRAGNPSNFQGVAIYSHWQMTPAKWEIWGTHFRGPK